MNTKLHMIIAPSHRLGKHYANDMGFRESCCAIITTPDHLHHVQFDPGDEVQVIRPTSPEMWKAIEECCGLIEDGESVTVKIIQYNPRKG